MLRGLVDYGGDSGDENDEHGAPSTDEKSASNPIKRKRSLPDQPNAPLKRVKALPKLDDSLFIPAPVDDPSKHQGRKRTIPYVEGQFIAHVYVPFKPGNELLALLGEVVQSAQTANPAWHSLLEPVSNITAQKDTEQPISKFSPHLSLSRPVPLRAHQRDDFRKEVRKAAQKCCQFSASFVQLTTLMNDDKSRTFLCVEIGAGHQEFQLLSQSLASHLTSLRQLPYYAQPRFHISIAWILTPTPTITTLNINESDSIHADIPKENSCNQGLDDFFVATDLVVEQLQSRFSSRLLDLGKFNARSIEYMANTSGATNKPLPFEIELPIGFSLDSIDQYISELKYFISSSLVQSLVLTHPNEVAIQGALSAEDSIAKWWTWSGHVKPSDRERLINSLIQSATGQPIPQDIPLHPSLRHLIEQTSSLRLPRDADTTLVADPDSQRTTGMSPKKAHEVDRLSYLIDRTYRSTILTRLIVDVGAGQGYLSRRLANHPNTRVLALDGDEGQTEGASLRGQGLSHAERQRARNTSNKPDVGHDLHSTAVTHRTLFITSNSLLSAVDEWTAGLKLDPTEAPYPVLVTGLHACGSLTPAVLRCFVDLCIPSERGVLRGSERTWTPSALVLVGCCYNLMRNKDDFPLSRITTHTPPNINLELSQNHLQLAAQCPAQWTRSQSEMERAKLARRKIVWRALLARLLHTKAGGESSGRLGRLPDRAYASWDVFLQTACHKMGLDSARLAEPASHGPETEVLAFQLELLHLLRALIGPVIESLVIVDRVLYLAQELVSSDESPTFQVRAVNVFDQLSSGSARNIALIVEPLVNSADITKRL